MSYVMLLCLCGCGTDPGTPLLSFPMVVPSQEHDPACHIHSSAGKIRHFPRPPSGPKCTPTRTCLVISSQNRKQTVAQECNPMRHDRIRRHSRHKSGLWAPFLLWLLETKNKGVTELSMSDCQKLYI